MHLNDSRGRCPVSWDQGVVAAKHQVCLHKGPRPAPAEGAQDAQRTRAERHFLVETKAYPVWGLWAVWAVLGAYRVQGCCYGKSEF